MNTERTIATIRRVLIGNPAADVKFVDAIAADSHFVSTNGRVLVLFVNPEHGELIDELRSQFSVVIVTHSMQQAARVSQRTAFFHLGNLVEYDETTQIFTNPKDPRTESYISGRIG